MMNKIYKITIKNMKNKRNKRKIINQGINNLYIKSTKIVNNALI